MGLEHQVERPGLGELGRPAVRADAVDLVLAPALVALPAVDQGVGEVGQVTRGLPHRRWRQDGGVQAHHVGPALDHRLPPGVLHIAEQVHPQRAVVVGGAEAAVDLRRLEDEPPALAQADHLLHEVGRLGRVGGGLLLRHGERAYRTRHRRPPPRRPGRRGPEEPGGRPGGIGVSAAGPRGETGERPARPGVAHGGPVGAGVVGRWVPGWPATASRTARPRRRTARPPRRSPTDG